MILLIFLLLLCLQSLEGTYVTIIGKVKRADGLGRQTLELLELYKNHFSVNCIATRPPDFKEVSKELQNLIHFKDAKTTPLGSVVIFEECLWFPEGQDIHELIAKPKRKDQIRIAYSMFDATEIPPEFTEIINKYFDAVAVPDKFHIDVYRKCQVKVPIFELPLGLDLKKLLMRPLKETRGTPLIFANLGSCVKRKNQITLVRAFAKAFPNQNDVKLLLNSRYSDGKCYLELWLEVNKQKNSNIILQQKELPTSEYINTLGKIDCLVNISKGEGFSIQPREAMALGIPVILTDNTAQSTLCESGLVRAVPSLIKEKSYSTILQRTIGEDFNCEIDDVVEALKDIYENYDYYLSLSQERRQFAMQYDFSHLMARYLNLVAPKTLNFGEVDEVTDEGLTTSSKELYEKYKLLLKKKLSHE